MQALQSSVKQIPGSISHLAGSQLARRASVIVGVVAAIALIALIGKRVAANAKHSSVDASVRRERIPPTKRSTLTILQPVKDIKLYGQTLDPNEIFNIILPRIMDGTTYFMCFREHDSENPLYLGPDWGDKPTFMFEFDRKNQQNPIKVSNSLNAATPITLCQGKLERALNQLYRAQQAR